MSVVMCSKANGARDMKQVKSMTKHGYGWHFVCPCYCSERQHSVVRKGTVTLGWFAHCKALADTLTGSDTAASGKEHTAIGYKISATGPQGDTALGFHTAASEGSTAMGHGCTAQLHRNGCLGGGHGIRVTCCQLQRARQAVQRGCCRGRQAAGVRMSSQSSACEHSSAARHAPFLPEADT